MSIVASSVVQVSFNKIALQICAMIGQPKGRSLLVIHPFSVVGDGGIILADSLLHYYSML